MQRTVAEYFVGVLEREKRTVEPPRTRLRVEMQRLESQLRIAKSVRRQVPPQIGTHRTNPVEQLFEEHERRLMANLDALQDAQRQFM